MPDSVANGNNGDFVKKHKKGVIAAVIGVAVVLVYLVFIRGRSNTGATTSSAVPLLTTGGGNLSFPNPIILPPSPGTNPPPKPPKPPHKRRRHHHHRPHHGPHSTWAGTNGNNAFNTLPRAGGIVPINNLTHAHITHTGGGNHHTGNFQH